MAPDTKFPQLLMSIPEAGVGICAAESAGSPGTGILLSTRQVGHRPEPKSCQGFHFPAPGTAGTGLGELGFCVCSAPGHSRTKVALMCESYGKG